jgi:hypothetical protein
LLLFTHLIVEVRPEMNDLIHAVKVTTVLASRVQYMHTAATDVWSQATDHSVRAMFVFGAGRRASFLTVQ